MRRKPIVWDPLTSIFTDYSKSEKTAGIKCPE